MQHTECFSWCRIPHGGVEVDKCFLFLLTSVDLQPPSKRRHTLQAPSVPLQAPSYPPSAVGSPPSAVGYPFASVGYSSAAVGCPPTVIVALQVPSNCVPE